MIVGHSKSGEFVDNGSCLFDAQPSPPGTIVGYRMIHHDVGVLKKDRASTLGSMLVLSTIVPLGLLPTSVERMTRWHQEQGKFTGVQMVSQQSINENSTPHSRKCPDTLPSSTGYLKLAAKFTLIEDPLGCNSIYPPS